VARLHKVGKPYTFSIEQFGTRISAEKTPDENIEFMGWYVYPARLGITSAVKRMNASFVYRVWQFSKMNIRAKSPLPFNLVGSPAATHPNQKVNKSIQFTSTGRTILAVGILSVAMIFAAPNAEALSSVAIIRQNESTGLEIANHLSSLETAAGNTSTIFTAVPGDLSGFDQVWDLRYFDAITAPVSAQYLSFLQSGRAIFTMGENSNAIFGPRNTSLFNLVTVAGGGSLVFTTPSSVQTVLAPFNLLIPGSTLTYIAPGGVSSAGTGQFMTEDGGGAGSAVAWEAGTLANAAPGTLAMVFDLNFMRPIADANSQQFTRNIITFMDNSAGTTAVPDRGTTLALLVMALAAMALMVRATGRKQRALREAVIAA